MDHKSDNRPAPKPENNTKSKREERRKYQTIKAEVYEAEQTNRKYLHCYEYKQGWWRLGGLSALKYYYDIAPEIKHTTIVKRMDRDYKNRWDTGQVTFNSFKTAKEKFRAAGCTKWQKHSDYWYSFVLPKPMTTEDVKRLLTTDKRQHEMINQTLMPENNYPKIYTAIRAVSKALTERTRKLDAANRELYGGGVAQKIEQQKIQFILMANGQTTPETFFTQFIKQLDYTLAWLLATHDYFIFDSQQQLIRVANQIISLKESCQNVLDDLRK